MNKILIKAVFMPKYTVELYETGGKYIIASRADGEIKYGTLLADLGLACRIFDLTIDKLEGR
jgi:hypothetical protein